MDLVPPTCIVFILVGWLLGVLAHIGIFIRGEWHVQAPKLVVGCACFFVSMILYWLVFRSTIRTEIEHLGDSIACMCLGLLPGLFSSIILYRTSSLHRLTAADFPGPFAARISKLWHVWQCRSSRNHVVLDRLYHEYGDFVRTGPSEITIFRPEVFMAIDGPHTECAKAEWYDILHPNVALSTTRVRATHAARRRQWNRGFSSKALLLHEAKMLRHITQLDRCIEADVDHGRPTNAKNLMYWFGFDAMGDFVFNHPFGMLKAKKWHHILEQSYRAIELLGPFGPAPWLVHVGFHLLPRLGKLRDWHEMTTWCRTVMERRLQDEALQKELDMTYYLMMQEEQEQANGAADTKSDYLSAREHNRFWLQGDSLLIIVAGSAPIATALTFLLGELAQKPEQIGKLYEELQGIDPTDLDTIARLPHLDACITETLRLWPGLLTGGARKTGKNGSWIAGRFIPPETTVVAPKYVIARREDCFVHAREFIPERWTSRPELVINSTASTPFGTGAASCVGRVLATDIIKLTAASLIRKYSFALAPGEQAHGVSKDVHDMFMPRPGELSLCFKLRE